MPLKKPGLGALNFSMERQDSFHLSETGTFSQDQFVFGRHGITQSPSSHGEVSALRLQDVELGRILGRGNSSRVYLATHIQTGKLLAMKVLQEEVEASRVARDTRTRVLPKRTDRGGGNRPAIGSLAGRRHLLK